MRRAFTLIELIVVVVVLALLSSLTVYSLGGTMDRHRISSAIETLEAFDAAARRSARAKHSTVVATIDQPNARFRIAGGQREKVFQLPRRVTVDEVRVASARRGQSVSSVRINGQGRSQSYALRLRRGDLTQWMLVLGFSGQVVQLNSAGEVNAMLTR